MAVRTRVRKIRSSIVKSAECNGWMGPLDATDRLTRIAQIAAYIDEIQKILGVTLDHNTEHTGERVARMLVDDMFEGRWAEPPKITEFENPHNYDQLIVVGPIDFTSTCAHHWMPFMGQAYIGMLPGSKGKIMGLSKFARIVRFFSKRHQIQEDLTTQIIDFIEETLQPMATGVRMVATHGCVSCRGVEQHNMKMVTQQLRGMMLKDNKLRDEFMDACRDAKNHT